MGEYQEIHHYNREHTANYNHRVFSFVRWSNIEKLIIVSNFAADEKYAFTLEIPEDIIHAWEFKDGKYKVSDQLYQKQTKIMEVENGIGRVPIELEPLESYLFKFIQ